MLPNMRKTVTHSPILKLLLCLATAFFSLPSVSVGATPEASESVPHRTQDNAEELAQTRTSHDRLRMSRSLASSHVATSARVLSVPTRDPRTVPLSARTRPMAAPSFSRTLPLLC